MIIDKLENAFKYYSLGENLAKGLKYLQENDLSQTPAGKITIDGENLFANLNEGMTKDEETTPWEIHKAHTDIQFVIKGKELMGWSNKEFFAPTTEFDTEKDIQFGDVPRESANGFLVVPQGYFVIFTPEDAHKPALKITTGEIVKKVIVKVKNN